MKTLIDTMNTIFISYNVARSKLKQEEKTLTEENVEFFYHLLFKSLQYILTSYPSPVFCWEGKNSSSWRKQVFPGYKENRKDARSEDEYQVLKTTLKKIREVLNYFPSKHLSVENAEADDVIYALCDKYQDEDKILVISSDRDLTQLMNWYDNVEIYNPIKRISFPKDEHIIKQKAICGDASDGIPGLHRIGPKTFEKMLEDENKWNEIISKGNNRKIYEDFLKIIDLSRFPSEKHEEIKQLDENTPINEFQPNKIEKFYFDNKLKSLLDYWDKTKQEIYTLNYDLNELMNSSVDSKNLNDYNEENDELDDIIEEFV